MKINYEIYKVKVCSELGINDNVFNTFKKIGKELQNIYTNQCNGYLTKDNKEDVYTLQKEEVREKYLTHRATEFADEHNLYIYFQTDPRGATIYLSREELTESNYTNGSCIY